MNDTSIPDTVSVSPRIGAGIGATVTISIDDKNIEVPIGTTIVEAARKAGIRIPTLCHHNDLCASGVCRVCVVEIEGERILQASCSYPVIRPIKVRTSTAAIRKARRHVIDLLLSEHYGECTTCTRNLSCELQSLAKEYGVDSYRFGRPEKPVHKTDESSYSIIRDMNKCILCRRCIATCSGLQEVGVLGIVGRGKKTAVTTYLDKPLGDTLCINCGQCINRCPTGALRTNDPTDRVWAAIEDPGKHVVIQTAPAPRAAIGEEFSLEPGASYTRQINTALRRCGFDRVFDTNFATDLTIFEEGTELIIRLFNNLVKGDCSHPLPQFTSCSPGWIKYIEHFHPDYLPNVSSCKSPQQMFGALIKSWYAKINNIDPSNIISVALMPCSAKKFECNRPEMSDSGHWDVDYALTTRETAQMIREAGIDLTAMPESDFDDPFGTASGSGVIFGATEGVMEAALRTVIELITGEKVESLYAHADIIPVRGFEGCRYLELKIPERVDPVPELISHLVPDWNWIKGATLNVGVAHGTANAKKVMEDIKAGGRFSRCHFIEFMACPGGCPGGGGQPVPTNKTIREARARAIYAEDTVYGEMGKTRKGHENRAVLRVYNEFLIDGPCGRYSHHYLHTRYTPRGKYIGAIKSLSGRYE